ncbi:MAG: FkbM family methyltransferase [Tepidisphaeraceae bacterium]
MALSLQYDEARLIQDYFAKHPRTGTMIDVGAQFGTSFRPYLNLGWRCVAFEPDSTKFDKLRTYTANPLLTFRPCAVGDKHADDVQFFTSAESTGIASLVPFRQSHTPAEKVAVTTLASELKDAGIRAVDYLKIDTEGYDLQVLRGHDWTVRPEVIMCEMDEVKTRHLGHDFRALGDLLVAHGYVVWLSQWAPLLRYGSGHTWHSITPYPCPLHHPDAWGNFVAVRQDAFVESMTNLITPHANS